MPTLTNDQIKTYLIERYNADDAMPCPDNAGDWHVYGKMPNSDTHGKFYAGHRSDIAADYLLGY